MMFFSNWMIFRFHVNFQGCIELYCLNRFGFTKKQLPGLNFIICFGLKYLNGKETLDMFHWCPSAQLQAAFTNSWKSFSEGCMTAWQEHCMVELLYISYKAFQSLSKTMKNHEKQRIF